MKKIFLVIITGLVILIAIFLILKNFETKKYSNDVVDINEQGLLLDSYKFIGVAKDFSKECATDGYCGFRIGERIITIAGGMGYCSYPKEMGTFQFDDWNDIEGLKVEVYVKKEFENRYTLCGSKDFYVKAVN